MPERISLNGKDTFTLNEFEALSKKLFKKYGAKTLYLKLNKRQTKLFFLYVNQLQSIYERKPKAEDKREVFLCVVTGKRPKWLG